MTRFSEAEAILPPGSVVVGVNAWASTWKQRPGDDVCIGLRFVPDAELEDARIEAFKRASGLYPHHERSPESTELWRLSFYDALIRWIVARGTCDPNDARKPLDLFAAGAEDIVPLALTDHGIQRIFDSWERMRIEADIGIAAATDADIDQLGALLPRLRILEETARSRALRLRRLMRFVLEELEAAQDRT